MNKFVFFVFTLLIFNAAALAKDAAPPQPVTLVAWESDESAAMLARSTHKADFFVLANNFTSQANGAFCGPATAAIVLNAMKLGKRDDLPVDKSSITADEAKYLGTYNPFLGKYTQENIYAAGVKSKVEILGKPIDIKGEQKSDAGIQLRQFSTLLAANGVDAELHVVTDDMPDDAIKAALIKNLSTKGDYAIVNFARKSLGQQGGGHISPLGAYDEVSDSFLLMDVNPNRAMWTWVKSKDLIAAMRTFDTVENRGFLLVSEAKKS